MRIVVFVLLVFSSLLTSAQVNMELIQAEIDKSVWREFKSAFETIDAKALNEIYADETLRVTPEGIDTENLFKIRNIERFQMLKENSASIQLNFWFESRHTNSDTSYEVGYYKISTQIKDKTSINYGQFHIVLKRIAGNWKIVQDWDTTSINGRSIGQKEFECNGKSRVY